MITSTSNIQVKNLSALIKKAKTRNEQAAFIIEGRKMFEEVLARKQLLIKAYFSERYFSEQYNSETPDFPFEVLADSVFETVSETVTPQGVMAVVKMPEYRVEQMLQPDATLLLLEDIRDPGNLGTILRTAEAAGVSGVVLSKDSVDIFNPKVIRSTMGAIFRVPFLYTENFEEFLKNLRREGIHLYAAHLKGELTYQQADYQGKIGILIGNEANGLSERITELADRKVIIPMSGEGESLNAAVAAALLMYEARRNKK